LLNFKQLPEHSSRSLFKLLQKSIESDENPKTRRSESVPENWNKFYQNLFRIDKCFDDTLIVNNGSLLEDTTVDNGTNINTINHAQI
jgi:hypothetical protein